VRTFVIRIIGAAGHAPAAPDEGPWYVLSYDPDYMEGRGELVTTPDPHRAQQFATNSAAWEFWRRTSKVKPLRSDGKANRPLTAFTIMVEPLREEAAGE
jgi:hypothetical protein